MFLFLQAVAALGCVFATSPIVLSVLRFVTGFTLASCILSQYTFLIELVGPSKRTLAAVLSAKLWLPAAALDTTLAYLLGYWKYTVIAGSVSGFLLLPIYK